MADTKVSLLSAASALTGTEVVPGVQAGSVKITAAQIKTFANASPSFTGSETHAGTDVWTPAAMGALVIDVTKAQNTKSISVDSTFTFSGTPGATGQVFGVWVTNTDTNPHTLTIPSSISVNRGATITTTTIPASSRLLLQWQYDGANYVITGDPVATTGTGSYVCATSPTLVTPALGTPASGNLQSCTADGTTAVGFLSVPSNSQSVGYTAVLADAGKSIDHPATDANARTFTIPANASVAYPVGTCISFSNMTTQVVSIAITTDTLYLAGTGTTGTRSLAQYGVATARKITSTAWLISGSGLT